MKVTSDFFTGERITAKDQPSYYVIPTTVVIVITFFQPGRDSNIVQLLRLRLPWRCNCQTDNWSLNFQNIGQRCTNDHSLS